MNKALMASASRRLTQFTQSGAFMPIGVVLLLGLVTIPLSPTMLDVAFTLSIGVSMLVMLAVLQVRRPLDFSIFPSVLLAITLFRLALNVASTRVVLMNGHEGAGAAGGVIEAFGNFVVGGNLAIGIIIFSILTVINFVVITKGATRITEVSARFTLDALPGKQMSIDADLNAGVITREEAARRREDVRAEADFYGSMDGASKFVRGDAIAAILILSLSLIGGVIIGMLQHDMPLKDALHTFTLLSIGDGLASQIPALLVSAAVAMLVTRSTREQEMGATVQKQMISHPKALAMSAGAMAIIGVVPGMPNVPFLCLAIIMGYAAWRLHSAPKQEIGDEADEVEIQDRQATERAEPSWDEIRPVERVLIQVGYKLIPLLDKKAGGELVARLKGVRRKLSTELGFLIPSTQLRDNLDLEPHSYRILIDGVEQGRGTIYPDRMMAIDPGDAIPPLHGIVGVDPAYGVETIWVSTNDAPGAEAKGYRVIDPASVIATHYAMVLNSNAASLLGHDEVQALLSNYGKINQKLVDDLTPKLLPVATIVKVLQALLTERVPVKGIRQILEALVEHAPHTQSVEELTSAVRVALGGFILQEVAGNANPVEVYSLDPKLEHVLLSSSNGPARAIEPSLGERLHASLVEIVNKHAGTGTPAILLVNPQLRPTIAKFVRKSIPQLTVLSFSELQDDRQLSLLGVIQ